MVSRLAERFSAKVGSLGRFTSDQVPVSLVGSLTQAQEGWVTFYLNPKFLKVAQLTRATAIVTAQPIPDCEAIQLIHSNPYAAMAEITAFFHPVIHSFTGVSPQAFVHPEARVDPSATLYPFAFVDKGAQVGPRSVLYPHTFVGQGSCIGEDCVIYANVSIQEGCTLGDRVILQNGVVIGGDGFGFAPTGRDIKKIPQIGVVIIEDDVEIGANSSVDRGTFEPTRIHTGCKLDAQVHIGHNGDIGEWTMLCGQAGTAGSAKVGKHCIIAGKAGVSQGVTIGDRVIIGAAALAFSDISQAGEYQGVPAQPSMQWRREVASRKRLGDLVKKVAELEKAMAQMTKDDL